MITRASALKKASEEMKKAGLDTPQLDAEVILCDLLNIDRIQLHMYPEKEIAQDIYNKFLENIKKRLNRMPVQYIINRQEFMGMDFIVNENVLIPRGDTEILVEAVMDIYKKCCAPRAVKALDIGTGSGAIAVSIAKYIDFMEVIAADISVKAIETAAANALKHNVEDRVTFMQGSLFVPLQGKNLEETFDFMISNPPYISEKAFQCLSPQVKDYEPALALKGGKDGLDFYRSIIKDGPAYLKPLGWLIMEIGYDQGEEVKKLMQEGGLEKIKIIQDLSGLDRVISGRKPVALQNEI